MGSWLFARAAGGRWLVRMEDLDTPRVVPGVADDILQTLERLGLTWDGEIVFQSERNEVYEEAIRILRMKERLFPCACTRSELAHTASAPDRSDGSVATVYPGTCRAGLPPGKEAHAIRLRVPAGVFTFEDLVLGSYSEDVAAAVGDFVVKRADGPFAYQLAVVVDDAAQGITEVVRGADLLDSTARQIALQRAFDFPTPSYAHLPLVLGPAGKKLGKKHGALGQEPAAGRPREMLEEARRCFDPSRIPREPRRAPG